MRTTEGDYWPIPITLASDIECEVGDTIFSLRGDEGEHARPDHGQEIWERDVKREAEQVYGTTDEEHPGVAHDPRRGRSDNRGPDRGRRAARPRRGVHAPLPRTPRPARGQLEARVWKKIVAFQTRNPIHRAHEYLTKAALETCDGLFIHR